MKKILLSLTFFGVVWAAVALAPVAAKDKAPQQDLSKLIATAKATVSYKIACIEAGREVELSSPELHTLALTIFRASKFFNTTEDKIGYMAFYHASEIQKYGVSINVKDLLEESMKAFPPNSPMGKPSIETFNFFGAFYQTTARNNKIKGH